MTSELRMAVLADVHGNALALDAVLADAKRAGIDLVVNLGDNANGPLDPELSVALLRDAKAVHVRGNGDRMVGGEGAMTRSAEFARSRLDAAAIAWLRDLPGVVHGDGWTAFHGTPASDTEYLLEAVAAGGVALRTKEEIAALLRGVPGELLLCGHTHVPRLVRLDDGRLVVNPGSVGLPAYDDVRPFPHKMENGSPHARYAVVTRERAGWRVEFRAVTYDWARAAARAREAGWPDWARTLETGYA